MTGCAWDKKLSHLCCPGQVLAFSFIYLVGRWLAWSNENRASGNEKLHAWKIYFPQTTGLQSFFNLCSECSLFSLLPSLPSCFLQFFNFHSFNFCNNANDFRNKTRLLNTSLALYFSLLKVLSFATPSLSDFMDIFSNCTLKNPFVEVKIRHTSNWSMMEVSLFNFFHFMQQVTHAKGLWRCMCPWITKKLWHQLRKKRIQSY